MFTKFFQLILRKKLITVICLALIIVGGYFGYQKLTPSDTAPRYITAAAVKGPLIVSISGSGQVLASNQVDIKPKASGDVTYINAKTGQQVKMGALLAQIDSRSAYQTVKDAETSLETAKLDLEQLLAPVDSYTLLQAENSITSAKESLTKLGQDQESAVQALQQKKQTAEEDFATAYNDAYNKIANAFLDLPDIMTELNSVLYSKTLSSGNAQFNNTINVDSLGNSFLPTHSSERAAFENTFLNSAEASYATAKTAYDANSSNYKSANLYSDTEVIETLLDETIETAKNVSGTTKNEINLLDAWVEYRNGYGLQVFSQVTKDQSSLSSFLGQINSHLSTLLAIQKTISQDKQTIIDADDNLAKAAINDPVEIAQKQRSLQELEEKLVKTKAGADELSIRNKKLAIQQKENSLNDTKQKLADYSVRAPFDGVLASFNIAKGDSVSSSTTVGTLITNQKIAQLTLNENDAAQVKSGQKANIEFDAISDLTITGEVAEIDTLGTVSQGVVSYGVKIAFDVQDDRIKPGMSVSVSIVTDAKPNVLMVPFSAVKAQGATSYVEILVNNQPQKQTVVTGESNDTMIEITEGIEEGAQIITQTISSSTATSSAAQPQGGGGSMGGMMRIMQ